MLQLEVFIRQMTKSILQQRHISLYWNQANIREQIVRQMFSLN